MSWFNIKKGDESTERLYVLEIVVDGTVVYKVGKASGHSSKARMLQIIGSYFDAYRVTPVVKIVKDTACTEVFEKETLCHQELVEYKYVPDKTFSGCTEVFKADKEAVLEVYKRVLEGTKED